MVTPTLIPPLVASGFFVLRSPLLPFEEFSGWSEGLEGPETPEAAALERDHVRLRRRLRELVARPVVREAIFVASPTADEFIEKWLANPNPDAEIDIERALVRYLARMAGRCTPFGLFAGVSTGTIGAATGLVLEGQGTYRRTTRLDAEYLLKVVEALVAQGPGRQQMTFSPNATLYSAGGRRRYVRSQPSAEEGRHRLVSVRESSALSTAMLAATGGTTAALVAAALQDTGANADRIQQFVDDLIDQRVLVPDLDLRVTGGNAVYGLDEAASQIPAFVTIQAALGALDASPLGGGKERYRAAAAMLQALPLAPPSERLFQVDMAKPAQQLTLGADVVGELLRGAELLNRIEAQSEDAPLQRFIDRFTARYEERCVPLLEALDPDLGVSFDEDDPAAAPLLAGIGGSARQAPRNWGAREDHLLARVMEVQASGLDELVLTQRDIENLEREDAPPLPAACSVMGVVAAKSESDLAHGTFRVLVQDVGGPSGARLLGRFCHADPTLQGAVEEHLRAEEALDPGAIFAEIVHLPRARDVNVVARPMLRAYEIPCLGQSGRPLDQQIGLDDLLVSIEGGSITLRSKRLGRRVVPRLTSAHNFSSRGVAVYRFLCRLQSQGQGLHLGFWGPLESAPALPRVRHGRVVLACARWRIQATILGTRAERVADYKAVQEWRHRWRVPRYVAQTEFGGQLPVDLDNVLAVESLVHDIRSHGAAEIVELFPPPDEHPVTGPEGAFLHELIVPFVRTPAAKATEERAPSTDAPIRRIYGPGSEWVYARFYTGETVADGIITGSFGPLAERLLAEGAADRWFFMRYADPEYHLRLRIHGTGASAANGILPAMQALGQELLDSGLAWRVEFGTYQREVERYGGPEVIDQIEALFHADSEAVVAMLSLLDAGEAGESERWRLGVIGTHQLLVDLGLSAGERLSLVRGQRNGLTRRVGWRGPELGKVGERFRKERAQLQELFRAEPGGDHPLEPGLELLRARSLRIAPIGAELGRLELGGRLTMSRAGVASSLLHMYLNRLTRGNNVAQELVICDFLCRIYEGEARQGGR